MKTKICTRCKKELTINNFGARKRFTDGLSCWCKFCESEVSRNCYHKKRTQYRNRCTEYYHSHLLERKSYDLRRKFGVNISKNDLLFLLEEQDNKCAICRIKLDGRCHIDHIIPVDDGGVTEIANLQFLCKKCNIGKWTWSVTEYIKHCKRVVKNNG